MKRGTTIFLTLSLLAAPAIDCFAAEPKWPSELDEFIRSISNYESGQSGAALRRVEEALRHSVGNPDALRELELGLVQLLEPSSSYEAKKFACEQLAIIGSERALPALSRLLSEPQTAGLACLALTTFPPGKADNLLRDALLWPEGGNRLQIINVVGDRRDPRAAEPLSSLAGSTDPQIAQAAVAALAKLNTPAAWKALEGLDFKPGSETSGAVQEAKLRAAEGMTKGGDLKRAKIIYENLMGRSDIPAVRRSALSALLKLDRDQGEERILEVLSGSDSALKPVAISGMSNVSSPGAIEKFSSLLYHLKPEDQALMLDTLAKRDNDAVRLTLARALSSQESVVRRAAVSSLAKIADPYFAGMIARSAALASDPEENRVIEAALVNLKGGAETDKRLAAEMKTSSTKPRIQLIAALARRQGAGANPVLFEEIENTDPGVAKAAFRALAGTGTATNASQILLKLDSLHDASVRSEAESTAAQVLARVEPSTSRSALISDALAKAKTSDGKASLIGLLPSCGDAQALEAIRKAAADSEQQVRDAAVRALAGWPDNSAHDALMEYYRSGGGTAHELALRGLVRLVAEENSRPDSHVVEHYRQLIAGARNDGELKLILGALSGHGHPEALPLALPLLSNPGVRAEAVIAVKKVAEAIKAQNPQLAEEALKRLPSQ